MKTDIDNQEIILIEEHIRRLLGGMSFNNISVKCHQNKELDRNREEQVALNIDIDAGDLGKLLIGVQGNNLIALQHIIRCMLRKQIDEFVRVNVDVNGYNARHSINLSYVAEEAAKKAHRTGRTVVLQPMRASDRRLIHSSLSERSDIKTESIGDEPSRRVVVRPVFI